MKHHDLMVEICLKSHVFCPIITIDKGCTVLSWVWASKRNTAGNEVTSWGLQITKNPKFGG